MHTLGKVIFRQLLSIPKPDDERLNEEARMLGKEMKKVRDRENAQRETANKIV